MADLVVAAEDAQLGHPASAASDQPHRRHLALVIGMRKAKESTTPATTSPASKPSASA
jgi:hypothetical protein